MNSSESTRQQIAGPRIGASAVEIRRVIRAGGLRAPTSGLAPHHAQGNVTILPKAYAFDFLRFCATNRKACPVLGVSEPGAPTLPALGADLDVRTDIPVYRVYRHGELVAEPTDIRVWWRAELVTFVLGCSFSFEQALRDAGLPLRHVEEGKNVPMYRTNIGTRPAGPFGGPLVVSMRPMRAPAAVEAVRITASFSGVHGAPVHIGDPALIGISRLDCPDYGETVTVAADELPVFWACGVTAQSAIEHARPELAITHAPGAMLVTDLDVRRNTEL